MLVPMYSVSLFRGHGNEHLVIRLGGTRVGMHRRNRGLARVSDVPTTPHRYATHVKSLVVTNGHGLSQKTRYATAVAIKFSKFSNAVIPACSAYLNHRTEYDHGGDVKVVVWFRGCYSYDALVGAQYRHKLYTGSVN